MPSIRRPHFPSLGNLASFCTLLAFTAGCTSTGPGMRGVGHSMTLGPIYVGALPSGKGTVQVANHNAEGSVIIMPIIYGDNHSAADKSLNGSASVAAGTANESGPATSEQPAAAPDPANSPAVPTAPAPVKGTGQLTPGASGLESDAPAPSPLPSPLANSQKPTRELSPATSNANSPAAPAATEAP